MNAIRIGDVAAVFTNHLGPTQHGRYGDDRHGIGM